VCWDDVRVTCILKRGKNPPLQAAPYHYLTDHLKILQAVLMLLREPILDHLSRLQLAFKPKRQTHEVVYVLRSLSKRSLEWNAPLYILMEIFKAYDSVRHGVWGEATR